MLKLAGIAVAVLAIAAILFAAGIYRNRGTIVRRALEQVLSYVLQAPVSVGVVVVKPTEGIVEIRDLEIDNPAGYEGAKAMVFGKVRAEVDLASFAGETPTIGLIEISQASIQMETARGGSNIGQLYKNAKRLKGETVREDPNAPIEAGKSLVIREVRLASNTVSLRTALLKIEPIKAPLPDLTVRELGGPGRGVTPGEAIGAVLAALLENILKFGGDKLSPEMLGSLNESLGRAGGQLREKLDEVGLDEQADKAVDKLREGLGGLLDRRKEE
jgi:hypothetical protein